MRAAGKIHAPSDRLLKPGAEQLEGAEEQVRQKRADVGLAEVQRVKNFRAPSIA